MYDPFDGKSDYNYASRVKDFEIDIGYLISESSYQTYESPWTSPMHFYSAGGADNMNSGTHGTDQNRDSHKVMASDAFTPAELPLTKQEKKSSLTSLLASNISFVSASTKNDEKRRQQYGDDEKIDSAGIFPGMGQGVLNMALVMSSGKLRKATAIPSVDASNSDDELISDGPSVKNGLHNANLDAEVTGLMAINNQRRYTSQGMQPLKVSSVDTWRTQSTDNEDEIETKSALFRDEMDVKHDATRLTGGISHGYDLNRDPLAAAVDFHQSEDPCNSVFHSSKINTHHRATHTPLVSAMRNRGATSTEIAVARVRVACSTVNGTLSSDSEDSSDDDDDDLSQSRMTSRVTHTANSKGNTQDKNKKTQSKTSEKSSKCFNFDLDTVQMSLVQKMRQKELLKGKKKKRKGGVRFTTDPDVDPRTPSEHPPLESVSPFHSQRNSEYCSGGVEEDITVGVEIDIHSDRLDSLKIERQNKSASSSSAPRSIGPRDAQSKANGNLLEILGNILSNVFLSRSK